MIRRLAALFLTVMALLAFAAPSAFAAPTTPPRDLPSGFPADLKKFVGGTPEFKDGPWFHDPTCVNKGGNFGMYVNDAMLVESRLLYWSAPPDSRKQFWGGDPAADPNKEPPALPHTFPDTPAMRDAYKLPTDAGACTESLREWTNPAQNTWEFTWVSTPDPDTLEKMKKVPATYPAELPVEQFTNACTDQQSPYCDKAMFADCSRVLMSPTKHELCQRWDLAVAHLYSGLAGFIENNATFLDKVKQFLGVVNLYNQIMGRLWVDGFVAAGSVFPAAQIAKFVVNPLGAVDDLANSMHEAATSFTTEVLQALGSVGNFDPASPWFLTTYAASTGIGLVVMAIMSILMLIRAGTGAGGRDELSQALFKYLPMGMFLAVFAPAFAVLLGEGVQGLTNGIAGWDAGYLNAAVGKLTLIGAATATMIPGGAFIGIIIFGLLVIGAFGVFAGLAMQSIALPLSAVAAGIAWGMWVHPKWRRKAARVPLTYLGVLLAKPLIFFMLGVIFGLIDQGLSEPAMKAGGMALLSQLVLVIVALIVVGFAPWSLLKYAPLLPTKADSHDSQPSSGFGSTAVVGAAMGALGAHGLPQLRTGSGQPPPAAPAASAPAPQHTIRKAYATRLDKQPSLTSGRQELDAPSRPALSGSGPSGPASTSGGPGPTPSGGGAQPSGTPGGPGAGLGQGPGAGAGRGGGGGGGRSGVWPAAASTVPGTASQAAAAGMVAGQVLGPVGVAAQAGVAGVNKARQAAHDRHIPEVEDEDVIKGDS